MDGIYREQGSRSGGLNWPSDSWHMSTGVSNKPRTKTRMGRGQVLVQRRLVNRRQEGDRSVLLEYGAERCYGRALGLNGLRPGSDTGSLTASMMMMMLISKAHREWAICASRPQTNAPSGPWTATLSTHGDHQKILAHLFARADAPRSTPGAGSDSPSLEGGNGPGWLVQEGARDFGYEMPPMTPMTPVQSLTHCFPKSPAPIESGRRVTSFRRHAVVMAKSYGRGLCSP
ncbi:hypothetical protein VDBG_01833 [Verticillium alfalfae VaMs.102]|uniref:Uncharacterized protein n=1 Tax=Verticillium alfalfae (strain VaMs.102 / ATCC MYA-4576 / FGSC 10136) TaxID=526221 RepID=C9SBJ0_VERA1|nr:hypothetical protein VDBG_01833 [Verticillium alfalfae VaMs.102]EEY15724.1 hypothetical protein VDBG_01833 [Verticillium alfalfae VaMs.102]